MIKSNRLADVLKLEHITPVHAEGHICIELRDPLTNKVIQKTAGKNMVFPQTFNNAPFAPSSFADNSSVVLTDDDAPVSAALPYTTGNIVGYGFPSYPASNAYMGAYNAGGQALSQLSVDGVTHKYQYDFNAAQGNGTIKKISLGMQLGNGMVARYGRRPIVGYPSMISGISKGLTHYSLTYGTGYMRIVKKNILTGVDTLINISALIPPFANDKTYALVYDTALDKWYILYSPYTYSSGVYTITNGSLYEFTDDTFTAASTIMTNMNFAMTGFGNLGYKQNNKIVLPTGNALNVIDLANNYAITRTVYNENVVTYNDQGILTLKAFQGQTLGVVSGNYVYMMSANQGIIAILDTATMSIIGYINNTQQLTMAYMETYYNNIPELRFYISNFENTAPFGDAYTFTTLAAKVLDTPVVKTNANGMTVSYEIKWYY